MSDFYGVNYTKSNVNVPADKVDNGEFGGLVRVAYDSYTFSAIIATTDVLYMTKIPKGARVLDVVVKCSDLGTTGALNIGWQASVVSGESASATGFFAALDVNAAAIGKRMTAETAPSAGLHKSFSQEVQVVVVPSAITTATSGSISIAVEYVID